MRALILVSAATFVALGCAAAPPPPPAETKVRAEAYRVEERNPGPEGFTAVALVALENTGDVPVTALKASFEVVSEGVIVSAGETPVTATVPPKGETRAEIPALVKYEALAEIPGQKARPYAVRGELFLSDGSVSFARAGAVRMPTQPKIDLGSLDLMGSDRAGLTANISVTLENSNAYPLDVRQIGWKLRLAGKDYGTGEIAVGASVKPASSTSFQFVVYHEPSELKQLGIKLGKSLSYDLELTLETVDGRSIPLKKTGSTDVLRG